MNIVLLLLCLLANVTNASSGVSKSLTDVALRCQEINAKILQLDHIDRNVTIYMLGDSTVRQQWACLCHDVVFASTVQTIGGHEWGLSFAKRTWKEFTDTHQRQLGDGRERIHVCDFEMKNGNHLRFIFPGLREFGWYQYSPLKDFDAVYKADVIYFNGGLHLLQLAPALLWRQTYRHIWEDAERRLKRFLDFARGIAPRMMMMLNHAVCEKDFVDSWKEVVDVLNTDPILAAELCADSVVNESKILCDIDEYLCDPPSYDVVVEECKHSTLTRHGSANFNQRLLEVWKAWTLEQDGDASNFGLNNAFEITDNKCELSKDGRHYLTIVDAEIQNLLAFVLDGL